MSARTTIISRKSIATLSLLILAILPIAWVAMWSARNTPAEYVYSGFLEDDFLFSKAQHQIYCTNVKTDKLVSCSLRCAKNVGRGVNGSSAWVISLSNDEKSVVVQRCNLDNEQPITTNVFPFDFRDFPRLQGRMVAMDNCILCLRNDHLESYDSLSGEILDSIAITGSLYIHPTIGTLPRNRLLLTDRSKTKSCRLVEAADDGKLKILADWATIDAYAFSEEGKSYVASLLPDGLTIEVRNAADGTVVSSITLAPDPTLALPLTQIRSNHSGSWISSASPSVTFDMFTGRELPVPSQFEIIERDGRNKRLIAISKASRIDPQSTCIVLDEPTGTEVARFKVDLKFDLAKVLQDSNELAIATTDFRVLIFDIRNGQLIRTIDPYALVRWSRIGVAIVFAFWCVIWVRFFATIHTYAWIDSTVCIAVFQAYMTYCSYHDVSFRYLNYLCLLGLGAMLGMIFMACNWMVLGRIRFSVRLLPLLLTFGLSIGLVVWWVDDDPTVSDESYLIPAIVVATVALTCLFLPLRWLNIRFAQIESTPFVQRDADSESQTRVDLRDIFLLTAVVAILVSIFRLIPISHWYPSQSIVEVFVVIGIHMVEIAGVGLFALWISMSRLSWVWTWGLVASSLLFILGLSVPQQVLWFPREFASAPSGAYLTCLLGFYAYRLRGWRFAKPR
jgi:hypothetical protein